MATSNVGTRDQAGFTLLEVLFAMIILAIGMLGLQALGIGAARSISEAERRSEYVEVAQLGLETRVQQVNASPSTVTLGEQCQAAAGTSLTVCTNVASVGMRTVRVSASVLKSAQTEPSYSISTYVYHPLIP